MGQKIEYEQGKKSSLQAKKESVRISEKPYLTLEEAAAYFNIGINKMREICKKPDCEYVLYSGSRMLIKRKILEKRLDTEFSI